MPKTVDHEERRRQIIRAANEVVANAGLSGLTFRAVAERLGGSTTLVTHYFASQRDLLDGFVTSLIEAWDDEIFRLELHARDPHVRLILFLEWLIPLTPKSIVEERSRINLLAAEEPESDTRFLFKAWEQKMRSLLRDHLRDLIAEDMLDVRVESLRVLTNGLAISAIEQPDCWPPERQLTALYQGLVDMNLGPSAATLIAVRAAHAASTDGRQ